MNRQVDIAEIFKVLTSFFPEVAKDLAKDQTSLLLMGN